MGPVEKGGYTFNPTPPVGVPPPPVVFDRAGRRAELAQRLADYRRDLHDQVPPKANPLLPYNSRQ
jgi:hypothetical protein